MDILEFGSEFRRKIVASGNNPATADTYANSITLLMAHYKKKYNSPLHITFEDLENYIIYLVDKKYSASYINSFVAASKRFFAINGQPRKCLKLQYRNNPAQSPNVLTHEECMKMCQAPIYVKHRAIINLLYYGAMRISELINLKISDISKDGKITVLNSKFGKSRTIPIPPHVINLLREYFKQCRPTEYLFNGDGGRAQYSAGSVRNIIKNTARTCGIHKNTYPHLMRSSRATILLDNGASYAYVCELLGHENIQTTYDYYHKLTIGSMKRQFEEIDAKLEKTQLS